MTNVVKQRKRRATEKLFKWWKKNLSKALAEAYVDALFKITGLQ